MKLAVESVEVATLKADGHVWDGLERARIPRDELGAFFSLDLDGQLARLVQLGPPPPPPDLFVRVLAGDAVLIETQDEKGFDAEWSAEGASAEVRPGATLEIEVWDRDVMFDDLIGRIEVQVPDAPAPADGGRWLLSGFGQVRRLVLRLV